MWHSPWPRRAAPSAAGERPVDHAELSELIETVRQLRLTLSADLSAAAGALDAGEPDVARDIIAADQQEVRQLSAPAVPIQHAPSARRRRALVALPAIPLVGALAITGAAALTSGSHRHQPSATSRSVVSAIGTPAAIQQTAASTLHQLERVVTRHPDQVVAVAAHLHHQLSALIATSPNNVRRLGAVRRLLLVEQRLLESHRGEATAIALAASRHVNDLLASAGVPTLVPTTVPPVAVKPTKVATTVPTPTTQPIKTSRPKPPTPSSAVVVPTATTSHSTKSSHHHRHHHHHLPTPLLSTGFLSDGL